MSFFAVSSWGKWFSRLMRISSVVFLAQKLVNKCPFAYLNKTGKSKVGAISTAQKAQTF